MARETFLLGIDETVGLEAHAQATEVWMKKLAQLGIGSLGNNEPFVFRPADPIPIDTAQAVASSIGSHSIYDLELPHPWALPFLNSIQTAACIDSNTSRVLTEHNIERSRNEQKVVITSNAVSEEFRRHNPSSVYAYSGNIEAGQLTYISVIRDISPVKKIRHR